MTKLQTDNRQTPSDPIADMKRALAELEQVLDETRSADLHTAVRRPR